jgi:nucleotide-binding universal stress UspA family protein
MIPFRSILFAADFSERSRRAFRVASAITRPQQTHLHVLHVTEEAHVVEQSVAFGEAGVPLLSESEPVAEPDRAALTERLRTLYPADDSDDVRYLLRRGAATQEILRVADEVQADLIVLGSHGRSGLGRLVMGSVAEAVLRKAHCSVLIKRSTESVADTPSAIHSILHPTDFSQESTAAQCVARELARELGARLLLLYVEPIDTMIAYLGNLMADEDLPDWRAALEALQRSIEGPDLKAPVEIELRQGDPIQEILDVARVRNSDLIVLGSHGRSGLSRLLMGSVAEAILHGSTVPVLVVKSSNPAMIPERQSHQSATLL